MKKFYVGSRTVLQSDWAKVTEQQAIDHAKQLLTSCDDYRDFDEIPIVKVVAIVKRERVPLKVERIK